MSKIVPFQRPVSKREGPYFCGAPMGPYGRYAGSPQAPKDNAPSTPDAEHDQDEKQGA